MAPTGARRLGLRCRVVRPGAGLRDGHHRGVDRQLAWRNRLGVDGTPGPNVDTESYNWGQNGQLFTYNYCLEMGVTPSPSPTRLETAFVVGTAKAITTSTSGERLWPPGATTTIQRATHFAWSSATASTPRPATSTPTRSLPTMTSVNTPSTATLPGSTTATATATSTSTKTAFATPSKFQGVKSLGPATTTHKPRTLRPWVRPAPTPPTMTWTATATACCPNS